MNLQELVQQYRGATLPKLVEHHIKTMDEPTLLQAIKGTYAHLPIEFLDQIDAYTLDYAQKWFGPHILTADLGDIFSDTIQDIKRFAAEVGVSLNDDQVFDMFNLIVMRLSYFAHSDPDLRKMFGIKKGWFS